MLCKRCGNSVSFTSAPADRGCNTCGNVLSFTSDDFLLSGANGLVHEIRPGQVNMGRLVEKAIREREFLIVEGPVGIGKSFAYLIPAILEGKRTVISTAKKQLQHQIARKDVPHLAVHLERPDIKVALIKGKSNYACRVKADHVPEIDRPSFLAWLDKTPTGDLTDLPGKARPRWWFDVTAEDCLGRSCKYAVRNECAYWQGRRQVATANVVIANHHLVAFDLRFGPFKILGPYDALIIDEAHQAEGAFRGAYAQSVHPGGFRRIIRAMDKAGMADGYKLEEPWAAMFEKVKDVDGEIHPNPFEDAGERTMSVLDQFLADITKEIGAETAQNIADEISADDVSGTPQRVVDDDTLANYEMLRRAIHRQRTALAAVKEPDQNTVVYITTSGERKLKVVNAAPINIGALAAPRFAQIATVVATSATIAVNGSFDYIQSRLGLNPSKDPAAPRKIEYAVLDSPFDYNRQALLYTPKNVPLPVSGNFDQTARGAYLGALTLEIAKLLRAARGNAFILFSATADLADVYQRLGDEDIGDVTLIPQGDDAEGALKRFLSTPHSAILGLKSFWEGVDVVGDKLRLVVITKLPFPQVSDPVIQAQARRIKAQVAERGQDERAAESQVFNTLQVPLMLTDLRQGAGRLIRSKTDRGVLAILDCRVWSGSSKRRPAADQRSYMGYGAATVSATGFAQKTSDFALVQKFLDMIERKSQEKAAKG